MEDEFKVLIDKLPVLFETLANVPLKPWNNLGSLPQNGIYVFYENERPIYIGRSNRMKDRIKEEEGDVGSETTCKIYIMEATRVTAL